MELKVPFLHHASKAVRALRVPVPSPVPEMPGVQIAARYREARIGGDFYDFTLATPTRLVFVLLDIAGKRDEALDIAAAVQDKFRVVSPELFGTLDLNEANALSDLAVTLNRALMEAAKGVRCAPAFLGSFDVDLGTLQYINAGHTPGILCDSGGVTSLPANGLPLGLFSHSTHDAQFAVLEPGAALVLASKGIVEARGGHRAEYGWERLEKHLRTAPVEDASAICEGVLHSIDEFRNGKAHGNDVTALALVRVAASKAARA